MLTQEDMLGYIRMKSESEYTLEDAEMVICYGDIESIPYEMIRFLLGVWRPKSVKRQKGILGDTPKIEVQSLKNRLGKEIYPYRVETSIEKIAERVAKMYATSVPMDMDRLVRNTKTDLVGLTSIIGEEYPGKMGDLRKMMALRTFENTFVEHLDETLQGGVSTFLHVVGIGTDDYLRPGK